MPIRNPSITEIINNVIEDLKRHTMNNKNFLNILCYIITAI